LFFHVKPLLRKDTLMQVTCLGATRTVTGT